MGDPAIAVIVAGMHRSGTSLLGRYLMHAGLDMGQELLGKAPSNPHGHFEDMAVLRLHEEVIGRHYETYRHKTWRWTRRLATRRLPQLTDGDRVSAVKLIEERRSKGRPWGWKDPRTSLFLTFWAELVPEGKFILVFRHPHLVVDSLCRRVGAALDDYRQNNSSLGMWIGYNRQVLRFYQQHRERCALFSLERAIATPDRLARLLSTRTGYPFSEAQFAACYDSSILQQNGKEKRRTSLRLRFKAMRIYGALLELSEI